MATRRKAQHAPERYTLTPEQQSALDRIESAWRTRREAHARKMRIADPRAGASPVSKREIVDLLLQWELESLGDAGELGR